MEHFQQQPIVHREACDECHHRKVRCVTDNGACQNCILWSKSCIFSPRSSMGRPRKRKALNTNSTSGDHTQSPTGTKSFDNIGNSATQQEPQLSSASSSTSHSSQFGILPAADYLPTPPITSDAVMDYLAQTGLNQRHPHDANFNIILEADCNSPTTEKTNASNNSRNTHSLASSGSRPLWDTVTVFSTMLFDLRRQRDRLFAKDPAAMIFDASSSQDCHEIFRQISSFCELTQRTFGAIDTTRGQIPLPETQSMTHLVIMTISTALDIYGLQVRLSESGWKDTQQQQNENHQTKNIEAAATAANTKQSRRQDTSYSRNNSNHNGATSTSSSSSNIFYQPSPLPLVLHLTTMDYHLAQMQWILSRLSLLLSCPSPSAPDTYSDSNKGSGSSGVALSHLPNDNGPAEELHKSQAETKGLRARIAEVSEGLKMKSGVEGGGA